MSRLYVSVFLIFFIGCSTELRESSAASGKQPEGIVGSFAVQRVYSFSKMNLDSKPVHWDRKQLDGRIFDVAVDVDSNGAGKIRSAALCRDLMILLTPFNQLGSLVIERFGLMKNIGLLTTLRTESECVNDYSDSKLAQVVVSAEPALDPNRQPRRKLPMNSGFLGLDESTFAADRKCDELSSRKLITLRTGIYTHQYSTACIGFVVGRPRDFRLILVAPLARYATMAEFIAQ